MRRALISGLLVFTLARPLTAAITPVGPELTVSGTNPAAAPAVAVFPSGGFVIVWQEYAAGGLWDVWSRQYDQNGNPLAAAARVNTTSAGCQRLPAVATDGAGQWIVAWQSDQAGQDRLYFRRFSPSGSALDPFEVVVDTLPTGEQRSAAVAAAPGGAFLVAWQGRGAAPDGSSWGVYARAFAASGSPISATVLVNQSTAGAQHSPAVAYATGAPNVFAVVWQSQGTDLDGSGIYRRTLSTTGVAQTAEQLVNVAAQGSQRNPRVASDSSGNFVVVWDSQPLGTAPVILVRRFHSSAAPIAGETLVASASLVGGPAVASAPGGDFLTAWPRAGTDTDLDADRRAFDHRSVGFDTVPLASSATGRQSGVAIGGGGDRIVAGWQSEAAGQNGQILARRFLISGQSFYTVTPCRMVDTRNPIGPYGGPALASGVPRTFTLAGAVCGIPATARALSLNVTVVPGPGGYVSLNPGDMPIPSTSTINFATGQVRANNAVLLVSRDGVGTLQAIAGLSGGSVHLIIDVNGYFE